MSTGRNSSPLDPNTLAEWIAVVLSVPLIWPKTSAAISIAVIVVCSYGIYSSLLPEARPSPPPRRILTRYRNQIGLAKQQLENRYGPAGTSHGFLEAMVSPDSAEAHDPNLCDKCFQPKSRHEHAREAAEVGNVPGKQ